jgi:hypothetical protein
VLVEGKDKRPNARSALLELGELPLQTRHAELPALDRKKGSFQTRRSAGQGDSLLLQPALRLGGRKSAALVGGAVGASW